MLAVPVGRALASQRPSPGAEAWRLRPDPPATHRGPAPRGFVTRHCMSPAPRFSLTSAPARWLWVPHQTGLQPGFRVQLSTCAAGHPARAKAESGWGFGAQVCSAALRPSVSSPVPWSSRVGSLLRVRPRQAPWLRLQLGEALENNALSVRAAQAVLRRPVPLQLADRDREHPQCPEPEGAPESGERPGTRQPRAPTAVLGWGWGATSSFLSV